MNEWVGRIERFGVVVGCFRDEGGYTRSDRFVDCEPSRAAGEVGRVPRLGGDVAQGADCRWAYAGYAGWKGKVGFTANGECRVAVSQPTSQGP